MVTEGGVGGIPRIWSNLGNLIQILTSNRNEDQDNKQEIHYTLHIYRDKYTDNLSE